MTVELAKEICIRFGIFRVNGDGPNLDDNSKKHKERHEEEHDQIGGPSKARAGAPLPKTPKHVSTSAPMTASTQCDQSGQPLASKKPIGSRKQDPERRTTDAPNDAPNDETDGKDEPEIVEVRRIPRKRSAQPEQDENRRARIGPANAELIKRFGVFQTNDDSDEDRSSAYTNIGLCEVPIGEVMTGKDIKRLVAASINRWGDLRVRPVNLTKTFHRVTVSDDELMQWPIDQTYVITSVQALTSLIKLGVTHCAYRSMMSFKLNILVSTLQGLHKQKLELYVQD